MALHISSGLHTQLLAVAAATPAEEVCGLLFGEGRIEDFQLTTNEAADPSRWFEIDNASLIAAMRAQRAGGPKLIGHFHSHPQGRAEPSSTDLAQASLDGQIWLIIAGEHMRAWRLTEGNGFDEIDLIMID